MGEAAGMIIGPILGGSASALVGGLMSDDGSDAARRASDAQERIAQAQLEFARERMRLEDEFRIPALRALSGELTGRSVNEIADPYVAQGRTAMDTAYRGGLNQLQENLARAGLRGSGQGANILKDYELGAAGDRFKNLMSGRNTAYGLLGGLANKDLWGAQAANAMQGAAGIYGNVANRGLLQSAQAGQAIGNLAYPLGQLAAQVPWGKVGSGIWSGLNWLGGLGGGGSSGAAPTSVGYLGGGYPGWSGGGGGTPSAWASYDPSNWEDWGVW